MKKSGKTPVRVPPAVRYLLKSLSGEKQRGPRRRRDLDHRPRKHRVEVLYPSIANRGFGINDIIDENRAGQGGLLQTGQ